MEVRYNAYFPPKATESAYRIFKFLRSNDNLVTATGGMAHFITGLDQSRLAQIAPLYGLEYDRIIPYVLRYESEMLKRQERNFATK